MLGVVREYNAIIASVAGERRLFTDRLRHLDRRVNSGVNKLTWNMDRSALEFYQKEARKFCREGTASVGRFKSGVEAVRAACTKIAGLMLVDLERKGVVQVQFFHRHAL
jgi:dynein heavy chain, axonemal